LFSDRVKRRFQRRSSEPRPFQRSRRSIETSGDVIKEFVTDSRLRVNVFLLSRLNQSRELFETPIPAEFRQNRLHFLGQSFLRFRNLDQALFFRPTSESTWERIGVFVRHSSRTRGSLYSRTRDQSIPMMRFSAKRFSDFGKIRYRASLLSLKPTIPKSVPLSLFRIVITRCFLICIWRWRSAAGFCHSV